MPATYEGIPDECPRIDTVINGDVEMMMREEMDPGSKVGMRGGDERGQDEQLMTISPPKAGHGPEIEIVLSRHRPQC